MSQEFWKEIDLAMNTNKEFILTEEEAKLMAKIEQENYEKNLESIEEVLERIRSELELRGFSVEKDISAKGLKFSFSLRGYHGPGGIISQFHIAGPLVLGVIDPKGDEAKSFSPNDIGACQQLGAYYDENKFTLYMQKVIRNYLSLDNLIFSREQYYRFRDLYSSK